VGKTVKAQTENSDT